jgi:hypothetical protein
VEFCACLPCVPTTQQIADSTKHVDIDRHFMKEKIDSRALCISFVSTMQEITSFFTKGLLRLSFELFVSSAR